MPANGITVKPFLPGTVKVIAATAPQSVWIC
jgi:hypothetical protein